MALVVRRWLLVVTHYHLKAKVTSKIYGPLPSLEIALVNDTIVDGAPARRTGPYISDPGINDQLIIIVVVNADFDTLQISVRRSRKDEPTFSPIISLTVEQDKWLQF